MTLQQLKDRQQALLNLIANVGGKNNIRKWVDELMVVEAKIEELEVKVIEIKFDDSNFNYTMPYAITINGQEYARFNTYAKCERHLAWVGLMAA